MEAKTAFRQTCAHPADRAVLVRNLRSCETGCSCPSSQGPPHTARRAPGCKLPPTTSTGRLRRMPARRDGVASSGKGRSRMPPSRLTRCVCGESARARERVLEGALESALESAPLENERERERERERASL